MRTKELQKLNEEQRAEKKKATKTPPTKALKNSNFVCLLHTENGEIQTKAHHYHDEKKHFYENICASTLRLNISEAVSFLDVRLKQHQQRWWLL